MSTQYSPDNVLLVLNNILVTGFAKDTFIELEREEDGWITYVGSLGDVCRTKNLNKLGKLTITLMATAPINDLLAAMAQTDEDDGSGFGSMQLKDLSGRMFAHGAEAWIKKRPKIERAHEAGTIQWEVTIAKLELFEGGNSSI